MRRMIGWGVFFVVLGLWIWLSALGVPYISFATNWPLLLVALGVYIIAHRARRHPPTPPGDPRHTLWAASRSLASSRRGISRAPGSAIGETVPRELR